MCEVIVLAAVTSRRALELEAKIVCPLRLCLLIGSGAGPLLVQGAVPTGLWIDCARGLVFVKD